MAIVPPIVQDFLINPDVSRVHAVAAVVEKHIGALRAELEQFLEPEAAPGPEVTPEVPAEP